MQAMLGAYCDNHRLWVAAFPTVFIVHDIINMTAFKISSPLLHWSSSHTEELRMK